MRLLSYGVMICAHVWQQTSPALCRAVVLRLLQLLRIGAIEMQVLLITTVCLFFVVTVIRFICLCLN